MRRVFLAVLVPRLLLMSSAVIAASGDHLMNGVPTPPDSKSLGTQPISSGGQLARYSTSTNPGRVIASYTQVLSDAGWTVTGSGGSGSSYGGGAGLQATNGPKYLSVNAGGPAGMTFVSVCVWPSKPSHANCGD
jgi:hypothetical protein